MFYPFSTGKTENSIFEMTIIPQVLNINNLRTTSAKFKPLERIKPLGSILNIL